jgi:protein-tyrosine-phosphatase
MGNKFNKVTPQEAIKILRKNGIEINENEAKKVLEIMYFLAKLIVNQNFNEK